MRVEFVLAREEDASFIARMRQRVWESTYRGIYSDEMIDCFDYQWHTQKDMLRIKSAAYEVYLIQCDQRSVGYMILYKANGLLLQSLYVLKEYQRCGIGTRAFSYVRTYCAGNGYGSFICHCQPENKSALRFYEKMGGVKIGEDMENEESWQNSVILEFEV